MAELRCDDGTVVPISKETEKALRKAFGGHKWVHGDVFRRKSTGTVMMVLEPVGDKRSVFCVDHRPYAVGHLICLKDATFLFNIKDKL